MARMLSLKKWLRKLLMQSKEVGDLDQLISSLQNAPKNYDPMKKTEGPAKAMEDNMMAMKKMGHSDGIMMAKSIIAHSKTAKLRSMAQKSIPEQGMEIKEFKQWISEHKG
jgi:hypothetical protein